MILAVCLNFALDLTYTVSALRPHETNRVREVRSRAGGKGVNVARVLDALGHEVVVTGFAGGRVGDAARAELGLRDALVDVAGETRRTLIVLEDEGGEPTGISEPGPVVSDGEWRAFVDAFRALAGEASAVALSGSLPPGVPADAYATLARESFAPVLLDTSGEALRQGVGGAPAIVKPNRLELADITYEDDPIVAADQVREMGPESVVVSTGAEGLLAVTPEGVFRAEPPEVVEGNPIGAGDAAAAALLAGLVTGTPWPERLADAVALSAAAVHAPVAGSFDAAAYERYRRTPPPPSVAPS